MARFMSVFAVLFAVGGNIRQISAATGSETAAIDAILSLKTQLNAIEARLTTLQKSIGQKSTSDDSRCWVRNIAEAVRTSKYRIAEQDLIELDNDDLIPNIVHDLYAGSPANVDIILEFASALKSAETKFRVLSSLHDEMRSGGNNDPLKLIILTTELQRLARLVTVETKRKVQVTVENIVEDIKTAASRTFKGAMIADKFQNNDEVDTLATALFDFRLDVANEVMEEVVDKVFGVVTAETIIDNISSSKYIQLAITGLAAVFNRFNFAGNLNNDVIVRLASNLEKLQQRENYAGLSKPLKDDVGDLVRRLPTCVRNLFFAKNVCLWNKGKNMYLYAADTSISYNSDRRSVFTYAGDPKPGASWFVERNGTEVFFRNVDYENEYLYPAGIYYDDDMRYVFTWIPGNNKEPQSAWTVELYGDYCYLKSADYKEYLVGASLRYNDMNSHVFTSITGKGVKSADEYQWQLRNCSSTKVW